MNGENQINGIPNINEVPIADTPAESFENLYGNNVAPQQPAQPQPGMAMQPNPGMMTQSVQPQPMPVQPNPGMIQQPVQPQPMPAQPSPGMMTQSVQPQPMPAQPNPGMMTQSVQPQPMPAQPNPGMIQQPVQPQPMAPNPGTIIMPETGQMTGNIAADIDADRMQSIEEQLSKTSQYNPEDLQQEKITIPTDNQYEKNKSGLAFVIVLFIILAVVIAFLPQITKLIK